MERNEAAEQFAKMLYTVGIEEGRNAFYASLEHPVGQHREEWEKAKNWYANQIEEERGFVNFLIREAMTLAVHGIAVRLDGASGYEYHNNNPIDYCVALRVYQNDSDAESDVPAQVIDICPTTYGEDVHDILLELVDK